mmetsp:Transcript_110523/g.174114  ORF Transcript_110523/g.174114 Transcript_110523/m.174114 type:complete len:214 (-) Transcript_110523:112-753(-)
MCHFLGHCCKDFASIHVFLERVPRDIATLAGFLTFLLYRPRSLPSSLRSSGTDLHVRWDCHRRTHERRERFLVGRCCGITYRLGYETRSKRNTAKSHRWLAGQIYMGAATSRRTYGPDKSSGDGFEDARILCYENSYPLWRARLDYIRLGWHLEVGYATDNRCNFASDLSDFPNSSCWRMPLRRDAPKSEPNRALGNDHRKWQRLHVGAHTYT